MHMFQCWSCIQIWEIDMESAEAKGCHLRNFFFDARAVERISRLSFYCDMNVRKCSALLYLALCQPHQRTQF